MAKRRTFVIFFLVCFLFLVMPFCSVFASSVNEIDLQKECVLEVSYVSGATSFSNANIKLHKIAEVNKDAYYTLTNSFAKTGLTLNGVQSVTEWDIIRSTLEAYIVAGNIQPTVTALTNNNGRVCFNNLKPGLYFVEALTDTANDVTCKFNSALIALPGFDKNGEWKYEIAVTSKSQIIPPSQEEINLNVIKLWQDEKNQNKRPKTVEIEIFKNGTVYKTTTLSEQNGWSYSWTAKNDGANWVVAEKNVPKEYTMTVHQQNQTFVVVNSYVSQKPPTDIPPTGDTQNIMLYIILMVVFGVALICLGILGKRNNNDK